MGLIIACKAFFRALGNKDKAQKFLDDVAGVKPEPKKIEKKKEEKVDHSHLRLLSILQQSGRLIDFLQEDISSFSDAQVGAAVRKIHEECGKSLEELVTIRPVYEEKEGATIQVPKGYDPSSIKIVGKASGEPPFKGVLVHKGWKAHKHSLPKKMGDQKQEVIHPAEVEVK